jgi:DNA-binding beta-propeller fold protein YncE
MKKNFVLLVLTILIMQIPTISYSSNIPRGSASIFLVDNIFDIAIHPHGKTAYISCPNRGLIAYVDISTQYPVFNPEDILVLPYPSTSKPTRLAFNTANNDLFILDENKHRLCIYDTDNPNISGSNTIDIDNGYSLFVGQYPKEIIVSADNQKIYICSEFYQPDSETDQPEYKTPVVVVIDLKWKWVENIIPLPQAEMPNAMAISNQKLYVGCWDTGAVFVIDLQDNSPEQYNIVQTLEVCPFIYDMIVKPDESLIYISVDSNNKNLYALDTSDLSLIEIPVQYPEGSTYNQREMILVNEILYVVSFSITSSIVSIIDTETNKQLMQEDVFYSGGDGAENIAISKDLKDLYIVHSRSGRIEKKDISAPWRRLQVDITGEGQGAIKSFPSGIDCHSLCQNALECDCVEKYNKDKNVRLSASWSNDHTFFKGWTGGNCSGTRGDCYVTVDDNISIAAHFESIDGAMNHCDFTPFPNKPIDSYGEYSYRLFSQNKFDDLTPIGHIVIHPTQNTTPYSGYIEVYIDDSPIQLFTNADLSASTAYRFEYSKGTHDMNLWFNASFSVEKKIVLRQWENNSERPEIEWRMVLDCSSCENELNVTPILLNTKRKKNLEKGSNASIVVETPYNGGIQSINVSGPGRCAWEATINTHWIQLLDGTDGFGSGTLVYKVSPNNEYKERTGTIIFSYHDQPFSTIPIIQKDKVLDHLTIQLPDNIVVEDEISIIPEGSSIPLNVIASWNSGLTEIVLADRWSVNLPQRLEIKSGAVNVGYVNSDTQARLTAYYTYNKRSRRAIKSVMIKDMSQLVALDIEADNFMIEGDQISVKALASWSNEDNLQDVTSQCIWSAEPSVNGFIDTNGLLTAFYVNDDQEIQISACLTYAGKELCGSKSVEIIFRSKLHGINISGCRSINEGDSCVYEARTLASNVDISTSCLWHIYPPHLAGIDSSGLLNALWINNNSMLTLIATCNENQQKYGATKNITILNNATFWIDAGDQYTLNEGESLKLRCLLNGNDVSQSCEWKLDDISIAQIDSNGRVTANMQDQNQTVTISASILKDGILMNDKKIITIIDTTALKGLYISGLTEIMENKFCNFKAFASWSNAPDTEITHQAQWSVDKQSYASITDYGRFQAQAVTSDQSVLVLASYLWNNNLIQASNSILIKEARDYFIRKGTVTYDGPQTGMLIVQAFDHSDLAFNNPMAYPFQKYWNNNTQTISFELILPSGDDYRIRAFIAHIDEKGKFNNSPDDCEAQGMYQGSTDDQCDIYLASPVYCPGFALDMNIQTRDYADTLSHQSVESVTTINTINNQLIVGLVALGVKDLDTYSANIHYDPKKIKFIGATEVLNTGHETIDSFLSQNNGKTIGFSESASGTDITLSSSLTGSNYREAPDGSGILAFITFELLDNTMATLLEITQANIIDSQGENKTVLNLRDGKVSTSAIPCEQQAWDFNQDGIVNYEDLNLFGDCWMKTETDDLWNPDYNLNQTPDIALNKQIINFKDLISFMVHWLETTSCQRQSLKK